VRVRKARPEDCEACAALDHTVITDHAWRMEVRDREGKMAVAFETVRLPRPVCLPYPRQDEDLVEGWDGCDLFLVLEISRHICGYVTARSLPGHGVAWIQDLVVDGRWRREGLGSHLLQEATEWARRNSLARLVAETSTKNYPAICFLRSNGWSLCGYVDQYWRTRDIALLFGRSLR